MGNNQDIYTVSEIFVKRIHAKSTVWYFSGPTYVAALTTHPRTTNNTI